MTNRRDFILSGAATLAGFSAKGAPIKSMLGANGGAISDSDSLPYDREVEYLESTGTQWIDTGVNVTTSTGFEIAAKFNSTAMGVFGANLPTSTGSTRFQFGRRDNVVGSDRLFWGIWSGTYYGNPTIDYSTEHLFKYIPSQSSSFFVDASAYAIGYNTKKYYPSESRLFYLFAVSDLSNAAVLPCSALCYGAKFYDGFTLVRDYIPVIDRNGVACMYDKVSGELFYNKGSGSFLTNEDA